MEPACSVFRLVPSERKLGVPVMPKHQPHYTYVKRKTKSYVEAYNYIITNEKELECYPRCRVFNIKKQNVGVLDCHAQFLSVIFVLLRRHPHSHACGRIKR